MNTLIVSVALLLSGAQNDFSNRATLVGQQFKGSVAGTPVLVCLYHGTSARFEIVPQGDTCAPFIEVR